MNDSSSLLRTALYAMHVDAGARLVGFAGYEMPLHYRPGVLKEHQHTRSAASLFDVSHMGQLRLTGSDAAPALETLVPSDLVGLAQNQQRYALFTNEEGGILDDLMITNVSDRSGSSLFVVVNAGCKVQDTAYVRDVLCIGSHYRCELASLNDHALLALQGPSAARIFAMFSASQGNRIDFSAWGFMSARNLNLCGASCLVTRSGYTGEDGFEISISNAHAQELAQGLLTHSDVQWAGLGARDSLRLEAGLCLYGHDLDANTTPVEANLAWAVSPARRAGGARAGGYPGASVIFQQMQEGAARRRVGLTGVERTPVREGAPIVSNDGAEIGRVTSGGVTVTPGPSYGRPIAMAYVPSARLASGEPLNAVVRGKILPLQVSTLPFIPHRYYRV